MSENLLLRGEALDALQYLRRQWDAPPAQTPTPPTSTAHVKMIYIDPPYNTGNVFAYRDALDPAQWCQMMRQRLAVARELLREDGLIFISIDFNQLAELKLECDRVFGAENLVANFVWVSNLKGRQFGAGPAGTHEYILTYARNAAKAQKLYGSVTRLRRLMPAVYALPEREIRRDARGAYVLKNQLYNTNSKFNEVTAPSMVFLIHFHPETGEVRTSALPCALPGSRSGSRSGSRPGSRDAVRLRGGEVVAQLEVSGPEGAAVQLPGEGWLTAWPHPNAKEGLRFHAWRWSRAKVEAQREDLEFIPGPDGQLQIWTKVRDFDRTRLKDLIMGPSTVTGQRELEALGLGGIFETPKPVELLQVLIEAATEPGDLVMDFFAGSGSFGQAAAQCDRPFILVQQEEPFASSRSAAAAARGLKTIADLAAARLQAAGVNFTQLHLS